MERVKRYKRELVILLLFLGVAFIFWSSIPLQRHFYEFVEPVQRFTAENQFLGISLFVLLGVLSTMFMPFSSYPLVPVMTAIWGPHLTFGLLMLGWLIGGVIAYGIAYFAGYPLVRSLVKPNELDRYTRMLEGRTGFWLVLLFRTVTPSEVGSYTLGVLRYHFSKYLIITLISELPVAYFGVYASHALLTEQRVLLIGLVVGGIVMWVSIAYLFRKAFQVRNPSMTFLNLARFIQSYTTNAKTDPRTAERIVAHITNPEGVVVELGTGDGNITKALLSRLGNRARLFAFEISQDEIESLKSIRDPRLVIVNADARKVRAELAARGVAEADFVVSSLPVTHWKRSNLAAFHSDIAELIGHRGAFINLCHTSYYLRYQLFQKFFRAVEHRISFRIPFPLSITLLRRR